MILKVFVTVIYLWLTLNSLANGQFFGGGPGDFIAPQSQAPVNPFNQPYGSQNVFSPGAQPSGFNRNPQGTNPQNIPQIPDSSFQPQGFRTPPFPDLGSLIAKAIFIPDKINQPVSQNPSPYNPPFAPQAPSSSFINPQQTDIFDPGVQRPSSIFNNPPQTDPFFNGPQQTSQFTPPQTNPFIPQQTSLFTPQQNIPFIPFNPPGAIPFNPPGAIPYNPPGTNPFNAPGAVPHSPPSEIIPQQPSEPIPFNIPKDIPFNLPQNFNSDRTNPLNPPVISPLASDQTIPVTQPETNPFSPTALLSTEPLSSLANTWKNRPFAPSPNTPQQGNPSYFRPQDQVPTFNVPQQTNTDTAGAQQTYPDITGPQQTNPDLTGSEQNNPDAASSQQTNLDLTGSQQTNPDIASPPQQTTLDSTGSQQDNPDTVVPQQTNPDLTDSQQSNSDSNPQQINSNPPDVQQANSDTTGLQQTDTESASPQKVDPTSDDNPMTLASELSSTVSKAPQDKRPSASLPQHSTGHTQSADPKRRRRPRLFLSRDGLKGMRIVCLFNNKHFYKNGFTPARLDPSLCTHLNYEFAILDPQTYEMMMGDPDIDVNFYQEACDLKRLNHELQVMVSLGGWVDSTKKYSELADDPAKRQNFIEKAIEFIQKHGFDGLDLAWEYPNCWEGAIGVSPKDKPNFVTLLKEIKNAFKPKGLLLSVSVGAIKREVDAAYDVPEISNNVDYINVMTYDMHGPWEKKTSHHVQFEKMPGDTDPYCNVKGGMQVWIDKGAHKKKLNMGLATYGRSFKKADPNQCGMGIPAVGAGAPGPKTKEGGLLSYSEICEYLNSGNWTEQEDKNAGFYACFADQFVGYDPPLMMVRKAKYVADSGMGGVLIKDLSGDDFEGKCFSMPFPILKMVKMELIHAMQHPHSTRHH